MGTTKSKQASKRVEAQAPTPKRAIAQAPSSGPQERTAVATEKIATALERIATALEARAEDAGRAEAIALIQGRIDELEAKVGEGSAEQA